MKIGQSRQCLTPKNKEFYLLGYRSPKRNEPAHGVHDDIYSNSMLFEQNGVYTFIWSADLLELPDSIAMDIKNKLHATYGLDKNQIILAVMHNHSSVRDFHTNWAYGQYSQEYYDFFVDSILKSYEECKKTMQEATCKYGKEIITGYYSNRNHKGELADNEVLVLRFYNGKNEPFAVLINWAVHSTAMGVNNMYLTGDIAGNTCRKLGEKWGYYPVFINGDAADCSNRHDRKGTDFAELERESVGLCEAIDQIETNIPLNLSEGKYALDHHYIDVDMNVYHKQLKDMIQQLENGSVSCDMPVDRLIQKCEEQLQLKEYHDEFDTQVLDLGDLRIFVFPGEISSVLGKMLKNSTKDKVVLIAGYANGFHYYFFHEEDYGKSFETIGNPVPKGVPEKIIKKMIETGNNLSNMSL